MLPEYRYTRRVYIVYRSGICQVQVRTPGAHLVRRTQPPSAKVKIWGVSYKCKCMCMTAVSTGAHLLRTADYGLLTSNHSARQGVQFVGRPCHKTVILKLLEKNKEQRAQLGLRLHVRPRTFCLLRLLQRRHWQLLQPTASCLLPRRLPSLHRLFCQLLDS